MALGRRIAHLERLVRDLFSYRFHAGKQKLVRVRQRHSARDGRRRAKRSPDPRLASRAEVKLGLFHLRVDAAVMRPRGARRSSHKRHRNKVGDRRGEAFRQFRVLKDASNER